MIDPEITQRRTLKCEVGYYLGLSVIGLIVDLGIAWALSQGFAIPLPLATAIGFLIAVSVNYVLLERFLFLRRSLSWPRLAKTYLLAQGALFIRIAATYGLSNVFGSSMQGDAAVLLLAAIISFIANFFFLRLFLG